ncbi:unnamed protein product [Rangifer tarandus platyrhynchus]|uniref:Uncharacterized protein n=1 Tax=Rangifer tarandus platyrhynchus TaxID=3082113 RepID=A0AC59Z5N3_RANTA
MSLAQHSRRRVAHLAPRCPLQLPHQEPGDSRTRIAAGRWTVTRRARAGRPVTPEPRGPPLPAPPTCSGEPRAPAAAPLRLPPAPQKPPRLRPPRDPAPGPAPSRAGDPGRGPLPPRSLPWGPPQGRLARGTGWAALPGRVLALLPAQVLLGAPVRPPPAPRSTKATSARAEREKEL